MSQIEVVPQQDGSWCWRRSEGETVTDLSDRCATRAEAIAGAREARDGERVVLLRPDGSEYGELDHAERSGEAQDVDLEPAGETGEVG